MVNYGIIIVSVGCGYSKENNGLSLVRQVVVVRRVIYGGQTSKLGKLDSV